jgi:hypothetical protein
LFFNCKIYSKLRSWFQCIVNVWFKYMKFEPNRHCLCLYFNHSQSLCSTQLINIESSSRRGVSSQVVSSHRQHWCVHCVFLIMHVIITFCKYYSIEKRMLWSFYARTPTDSSNLCRMDACSIYIHENLMFDNSDSFKCTGDAFISSVETFVFGSSHSFECPPRDIFRSVVVHIINKGCNRCPCLDCTPVNANSNYILGDLDMSKSPIGIKFNDFCILLLKHPAVISIVMTNPLN